MTTNDHLEHVAAEIAVSFNPGNEIESLIAEGFAKLVLGKISSQDYSPLLNYDLDVIESMIDGDSFEGIYIIRDDNQRINLSPEIFNKSGEYKTQ